LIQPFEPVMVETQEHTAVTIQFVYVRLELAYQVRERWQRGRELLRRGPWLARFAVLTKAAKRDEAGIPQPVVHQFQKKDDLERPRRAVQRQEAATTDGGACTKRAEPLFIGALAVLSKPPYRIPDPEVVVQYANGI